MPLFPHEHRVDRRANSIIRLNKNQEVTETKATFAVNSNATVINMKPASVVGAQQLEKWTEFLERTLQRETAAENCVRQ